MRARTLATVVQCGWMLTIATLLLSLYAKQSKAQPTSNSPVGTNKTPGSTGQQGHSGKAPGSTGQQSKAGRQQGTAQSNQQVEMITNLKAAKAVHNATVALGVGSQKQSWLTTEARTTNPLFTATQEGAGTMRFGPAPTTQPSCF